MSDVGLVYIYTGDGKGKTSAAIGGAIRALANNWRVGWIAFYKEASWQIGEHQLANMLNPEFSQKLEMKLLGKGFYIAKPESTLSVGKASVKVASVGTSGVVVDDDKLSAHQTAARVALEEANQMLKRQTKRLKLLILDEVCNAIDDGLIAEPAILDLLHSRQQTHVILTGRSASKALIKEADLVSRIEKIKHPYDRGLLAIKGLDF